MGLLSEMSCPLNCSCFSKHGYLLKSGCPLEKYELVFCLNIFSSGFSSQMIPPPPYCIGNVKSLKISNRFYCRSKNQSFFKNHAVLTEEIVFFCQLAIHCLGEKH